MMRRPTVIFGLGVLSAVTINATPVRPPAVPLVTHDPYLCIWSPSDKLTESFPVHWTGKTHGMSSMVRIGDKSFRLMGTKPDAVPAAQQTGLSVTPTQTIYSFEADGAQIQLRFLTPTLPDDLELAARPLTYLSWTVTSAKPAQVYFDISGEWCVNRPEQQVTWNREENADLNVVRMGAADQQVLKNRGDDLRIEWGWGYIAAPKAESRLMIASDEAARAAFMSGQGLPAADDARQPRAVRDQWPVMAAMLDFGASAVATTRTLALAYDDIVSMQYFDAQLRPFWRKNGAEMNKAVGTNQAVLNQALGNGEDGLADCQKRCEAFDKELLADLKAAGGDNYATIAALSYRQAWAGNKLCADANGHPLLFPKENNSNGCVATVDVIYPMAPLFLLMGADLAKSQLVPVLDYGMSARWKFPFAPHDLGTYPHATGQVYGGGERTEDNQMPVEESGNMLLLMAAVAQAEGNADFAGKYWPALTKWAAYLKEKGLDPENQLCTDDFAGHLAHNTNLSIKAILALAAYGQLAERRGESDVAKEYLALAKDYAAKWETMAKDGDHYKLAFDRAGTWSQKYNLVWDRILNLNIFSPEIAKTEMEFYKKKQNPFGLPLDNRSEYTKLDWITWTATLTRNKADFEALTSPIVKFINETPDRLPLTDWYFTHNGRFKGFIARPVVGGVFLEMLYHSDVWKKWFGRGPKVAKTWAPLEMSIHEEVIPTSDTTAQIWRYSFSAPAEGWQLPAFDASAWKEGPGSFGSKGTPGAKIRTEWTSKEIWLRRGFDLPANCATEKLLLWLCHDEDTEVYINGQLAAQVAGFTTEYRAIKLSKEILGSLKPTGNTLAIHCLNRTGGQNIDAGFAVKK